MRRYLVQRAPQHVPSPALLRMMAPALPLLVLLLTASSSSSGGGGGGGSGWGLLGVDDATDTDPDRILRIPRTRFFVLPDESTRARHLLRPAFPSAAAAVARAARLAGDPTGAADALGWAETIARNVLLLREVSRPAKLDAAAVLALLALRAGWPEEALQLSNSIAAADPFHRNAWIIASEAVLADTAVETAEAAEAEDKEEEDPSGSGAARGSGGGGGSSGGVGAGAAKRVRAARVAVQYVQQKSERERERERGDGRATYHPLATASMCSTCSLHPLSSLSSTC